MFPVTWRSLVEDLVHHLLEPMEVSGKSVIEVERFFSSILVLVKNFRRIFFGVLTANYENAWINNEESSLSHLFFLAQLKTQQQRATLVIATVLTGCDQCPNLGVQREVWELQQSRCWATDGNRKSRVCSRWYHKVSFLLRRSTLSSYYDSTEKNFCSKMGLDAGAKLHKEKRTITGPYLRMRCVTHHVLNPNKQKQTNKKKTRKQTICKQIRRETIRPLILCFGEPKWRL